MAPEIFKAQVSTIKKEKSLPSRSIIQFSIIFLAFIQVKVFFVADNIHPTTGLDFLLYSYTFTQKITHLAINI